MPLLVLRNVHLGYGVPLLDGVDLTVERGERVCVLGRNGEGKSTLLRVMAGEVAPDDGSVVVPEGLRVARLPQDVPPGLSGSLFDVVADGLGALAALVKDYHHASVAVAERGDDAALAALARAQQALEAADGWQVEQRAERVLAQIGLDPELDFAALSGGQKRRALLARALAVDPDVLLLDEPTNHLDIESREALVEALTEYSGAVILVSHDMHLLGLVADRLWLVKGGTVTPYTGDLEQYRRELLAGDEPEKPAEKPRERPARPARDAILALRAELRKCEERLSKLNEMREKLDVRLADPALYGKPDEAVVWQKKYAEVIEAQTRAESLWMDAAERLDRAEEEWNRPST